MRSAVVGGALLVVGAVAIAVGILPPAAAIAVGGRVWPILLFVLAITVVTELVAEAGLFVAVAHRTASWGRGRGWLLWLLVLALSVVCTVFLSLDTTAVLLTPVVVLVARHVGLPPVPFALTTIWMANTASLLLPVSNLTNLLAMHQLAHMSPLGFAALMALPALVAIVIPAGVLFLVYRKQLMHRYEESQPKAVDDRVLLVSSAVTVLVLVPLLVSGLPVWIPAVAAAAVLGGFFAVRRPGVLRFGLVPWQLIVLASGLFLVVEAAHSLGLGAVLSALSGKGTGPLDLFQLSASGALGANLVNNLPAYLTLEPVAGNPLRIAALLIGVNAGPLITPWASLATLLWHQRLKSLGVSISWRRYGLLGLVVVPLTVTAATLVLAFVHP